MVNVYRRLVTLPIWVLVGQDISDEWYDCPDWQYGAYDYKLTLVCSDTTCSEAFGETVYFYNVDCSQE